MEYNNKNIDLVKSIIHFFKFSESNKLVLFDLEQKTFQYVDEFSKVPMIEGYSEDEQSLIRRPMVLIDCRSRGWNNSVRITNYMTEAAQRLQLPLYIATPKIFVCVIPTSAALLRMRFTNNETQNNTLRIQFYTFVKRFLRKEYMEEPIAEIDPPPTWTRENTFATLLVEDPVL